MTMKPGRAKSAGPAQPVLFGLKGVAVLAVLCAAAWSASPGVAQIKAPPPPTGGDSGAQAEKKAPKSDPGTAKKKPVPGGKFEGTMTLLRIDEIVRRLDPETKAPRPGSWQFTISERPVVIITDILNNRMRILSPITKVETLPEGAMERMMQANFDTALDARYAVARGVVWATFIHPLAALHDRQFISAIGQTVNLSLTFGKTFSSGEMSFRGGDSNDLLRKRLIEELQKKGLPI